jgi:hypothetical protein
MTAPDRVPCCNPACKRTAPREDDPETEIICGKCWRALPQVLRDRYKQLSRREKKLLRLTGRRFEQRKIGLDDVARIASRIEKSRAENWREIRAYFQPGDKPSGLQGFLQEVGL